MDVVIERRQVLENIPTLQKARQKLVTTLAGLNSYLKSHESEWSEWARRIGLSASVITVGAAIACAPPPINSPITTDSLPKPKERTGISTQTPPPKIARAVPTAGAESKVFEKIGGLNVFVAKEIKKKLGDEGLVEMYGIINRYCEEYSCPKQQLNINENGQLEIGVLEEAQPGNIYLSEDFNPLPGKVGVREIMLDTITHALSHGIISPENPKQERLLYDGSKIVSSDGLVLEITPSEKTGKPPFKNRLLAEMVAETLAPAIKNGYESYNGGYKNLGVLGRIIAPDQKSRKEMARFLQKNDFEGIVRMIIPGRTITDQDRINILNMVSDYYFKDQLIKDKDAQKDLQNLREKGKYIFSPKQSLFETTIDANYALLMDSIMQGRVNNFNYDQYIDQIDYYFEYYNQRLTELNPSKFRDDAIKHLHSRQNIQTLQSIRLMLSQRIGQATKI